MKIFNIIILTIAMLSANLCLGLTSKDVRKLKDDAIAGDAQSALKLGNCYFFGDGTPQDYYSAFDWYFKAASKGNANAQFNVGLCYDTGLGAKKNKIEALDWYRKAAIKGVPQAQYNLAMIYKDGTKYETQEGVVKLDKNIDYTISLLKKATKQAFPPAIRELGKLYIVGTGIEENKEKGMEMIRDAATLKDPEASFLVAETLINSGDKDYKTIIPLLTYASEKGIPKAVEKLGEFYETGKGVKKDKDKAMACYKSAAKAGLTRSEVRMGEYAYYGIGMEPDMWVAKRWFSKAADKGDGYAIFMLGVFADQGIGEKVDKKKAIKYFTKSAQKGFPKAQYNLGMYYKEGVGVTKNQDMAMLWFRRAALNNIEKAQRELGFSYIKGYDGEVSYSSGLNWLNLAKSNGDELAGDYLNQMDMSSTIDSEYTEPLSEFNN